MNRIRLVAAQSVVRKILKIVPRVSLGFGLAFLCAAQPAAAQVYSFDRLVIDNTNKGDAFNCYARPKQPKTFRWGGTEYLFLDASTDVKIYDLDKPGTQLAAGNFGLGYNCVASLGIDSDLGNTEAEVTGAASSDVMAGDVATTQTSTAILGLDGILGTGVCDECRYGFIDNGSRSILFDLGTPSASSKPAFTGAWAYDSATIGLTYKDGSSQYVVAQGLTPSCSTDPRVPRWGVYRIVASGGQPTFEQVQCMASDWGGPDWGVEIPGSGGPNVVVYRVAGTKSVVVATIDANHAPATVSTIATASFSVDDHAYPGNPAYLLTTNPNTVPSTGIYAITASGSAVTVSQSAAVIPEPQDYLTGWEIPAVTVSGSGGYALLLTKADGSLAARGLFELSGLGTPTAKAVEVDHAYWNDPNSDFNTAAHDPSPEKIYELGAAFAPDGSGVYLARYYQMAYLAYTGQAQAPTARVSVTPSVPFPGDQVVISNESINWTTARLWITHTPSPDDTPVDTMDTGWGEGNLSLTWNSPEALDCTTAVGASAPYYAHVQIDDNGPIATVPINFNCTPAATISIAPTAPLANETVTLSAAGEGHAPISDAAYTWTITPPAGGTVTHPTGASTQVQLDPGGTWQFGVDVTYPHYNEVDANNAPISYVAHSDPTSLNVASAAAVLSVLPGTTVGPDVNVTLSGTSTRLAEGLTAHYQFLVDGSLQGACEGDITGQAGGTPDTTPVCTFAASAVTPDVQHDVSLELRGASGGLLSSASKTLTVRSTNIDFTWSPTSPAKGEAVNFTINGNADLAHSWTFGGANCLGDTSEQVCGTWGLCSGFDWAYRDAGPKNVTLKLSDGSTVTHQIQVANSGGCTNSCTYSLSSYSASFPATGGGGSVTVSTASGCSWSAQTSTSWITNLTPTSGTGPGSVSFRVATNTGTSSRSGYLVVAGKTFSVTQEGTGGGAGGSVDFTWSPSSPQRGEKVTFSISGAADSALSWNLGGANCSGETSTQSCGAFGCTPFEWAYRDAGAHTVTLTLDNGSSITHTLTVQAAGDCGGVGCTYSLSSSSQQAAAEGGTGQISVSCGSTCTWSAASNAGWLSVVQPTATATGSGLLRWSAAASTVQVQRTGTITITGGGTSKALTVVQAASTAPAQPESLIVPAAAQTAGDQHTSWRSDLRLYNPSDQAIIATLDFLPSYGDNNTYPSQNFSVPAHGTLWIENVIKLFVNEEATQGAVVITFTGDVAPSVVSRTYTSDPSGVTPGTYGQQIPAAFDTSLGHEGDVLYLPGVEHDASYRTNIGLVNPSDGIVTFKVTYHSANGSLSSSRTIPLAAKHYVQMTLPAAVGLEGVDMKGSVDVELTGGTNGTAWASVVDQVSGDPIFIQPLKP